MSKQPHAVLVEKVAGLIEECISAYATEVKELRSKYEAELSRLKEDNFKLRTENFSLRNQLLAKCSEKTLSHTKDDEPSHKKCTDAPNGLCEHGNSYLQNIGTHSSNENAEGDSIISDDSNALQAKEIEEQAASKTNQQEVTIKGKTQSEDEDEIIILDTKQPSKKEKSRDWQSTLTFLSTLGAQRRISEFFSPPNKSYFNDNDIDISSDTDSQKPIPSEVEINAKFPPLPLNLIATEEAPHNYLLHKQNEKTDNKESKTTNVLCTKEQKENAFIAMTDNETSKDCSKRTEQHPTIDKANEKKSKRSGCRSNTTKKEKSVTNHQNKEHDEPQDKTSHKRRKRECEKLVPTRSFDEMARLMNDDVTHSHQKKSSLEKVAGFAVNKNDVSVNSHLLEVRNRCKLNEMSGQTGIEENKITLETVTKVPQSHSNERPLYYPFIPSGGTYQKQSQDSEQSSLLRSSKDIQQGRFSESEQTPKLQTNRTIDQKLALHQADTKGQSHNTVGSMLHQQRLEISPLETGRVFPSVEVVRKKELREQLPGKECPHCKKFYAAICDDEAMREHLVKCCSRHREKYSAPPTPKGYWDTSFPDSQEPRCNEDSPDEADSF